MLHFKCTWLQCFCVVSEISLEQQIASKTMCVCKRCIRLHNLYCSCAPWRLTWMYNALLAPSIFLCRWIPILISFNFSSMPRFSSTLNHSKCSSISYGEMVVAYVKKIKTERNIFLEKKSTLFFAAAHIEWL